MRKFLMKSDTFLLLIYIILLYTNFVISMIIAYQVRIGVLHSYKKSYWNLFEKYVFLNS